MKQLQLVLLGSALMTLIIGVASAFQMWTLSAMMSLKVYSEGKSIVLFLKNPFLLEVSFTGGSDSTVVFWPTATALLSFVLQVGALVFIWQRRKK